MEQKIFLYGKRRRYMICQNLYGEWSVSDMFTDWGNNVGGSFRTKQDAMEYVDWSEEQGWY